MDAASRFAGGALLALALLALMQSSPAQRTLVSKATIGEGSTPTLSRPLPKVAMLLRQVELQQRVEELRQRDYIYRDSIQFDTLDSHDAVKHTESLGSEVFWLNGIRVSRLLTKDGKALDAEEQKKEDDRFNKSFDRAKQRRDKADAQGRETDGGGHEEVPFSRIFELGSFTNPRREQVNGRDTIVIDYLGDPKAKTHSYQEGVLRELAGTVWVDEEDKVIQHIEGHFDHDFKVMGGMAASVKKGTWFKASFTKVNGDAWLPAMAEADGRASYLLLFHLNGHFLGRTSDYRKFKATATILPNFEKVDPDPAVSDPQKPGVPKPLYFLDK